MGTTPVMEKIEIEQESLKNLDIARKWTMFLAILGFIFLGLLIIIGVIAGTFLSVFDSGESGLGLPESVVLILFIVITATNFLPVFYLFRFSKYTAHAVISKDRKELTKAFKNLKYFFIYLGILLIVIFSIYITVLIVSESSVTFLKGMI